MSGSGSGAAPVLSPAPILVPARLDLTTDSEQDIPLLVTVRETLHNNNINDLQNRGVIMLMILSYFSIQFYQLDLKTGLVMWNIFHNNQQMKMTQNRCLDQSHSIVSCSYK